VKQAATKSKGKYVQIGVTMSAWDVTPLRKDGDTCHKCGLQYTNESNNIESDNKRAKKKKKKAIEGGKAKRSSTTLEHTFKRNSK